MALDSAYRASGFYKFAALVYEWAIRKRSMGLRIMRLGVTVIIPSVGGFAVSLTRGDAVFSMGSDAWLPLSVIGLLIGAALLLFGGVLVFQDARDERAARERRMVLVVEQRGLQKKFASPLKDALPRSLMGQRIGKVIDVSPYFRDGALVEFGLAFTEVREVRNVLRQGLGEVEPSDVTVVYGGVAPIPLTFLVATYFDDLSAVVIMDWDRTANGWRGLDGYDDGDCLSEPDLSVVAPGAEEVALAISVSYQVDEEDVRVICGGWPLLRMSMGKVEIGNHWSEAKQQRMAEVFVQVIAKLANCGVLRVHLFVAAPNSVVFRLGRHLDRNWPALQVYQREPSDKIGFPWSIRMPSSNSSEPQLCPTPVPADVGDP